MKNVKGVSLIVLVITILVLSILAATVIVSLNNTNIIGQANEAVNKSNLQTLKEPVNLKVISHMAQNNGNIDTARLKSELQDEFGLEYNITEVDGKVSLLDKANKFIIEVSSKGVVTGKINGSQTPDPYASLKIGDKVQYTPTPGTYTTSADINPMGGDNTNEIQGAQTFTTTQQELESLEWIYIGKDQATGRHLITTTEPVDKSIALYGKGTLKMK